MGISRDSWHKRKPTGGKRHKSHKKRKYQLGRPAANTKLGPPRIRKIRVCGGNFKFRALRLDSGNFAWPSEGQARKARILDVVYNGSNNELVRTKTLVKNTIVLIDAAPFRTWYESFYALPLGRPNTQRYADKLKAGKKSKKSLKVFIQRKKKSSVEPALAEQFATGRLLACISSRPGQIGKADGYIVEGKELEFYLKKIKSKKQK